MLIAQIVECLTTNQKVTAYKRARLALLYILYINFV